MGEEAYERRSRNLSDLIEQHDKDLYRGNGKPGLTTRMQIAEDRVDALYEYNKKRENQHDSKLNILIGAAFTAIFGIVATLILTFMHLK